MCMLSERNTHARGKKLNQLEPGAAIARSEPVARSAMGGER